MYRYSSGALVFSAGTMQWAWGLDDSHDLNTATPPVQPASVDMQQATVNLFHDMGVDAGSLQAGLVAPTVGPDALAPSSTITYPAHNSTVAGRAAAGGRRHRWCRRLGGNARASQRSRCR